MSRGVVAAAVAAVVFAVMALAEEAPYAHHAPTACIRLACSHTLLRTVRPGPGRPPLGPPDALPTCLTVG